MLKFFRLGDRRIASDHRLTRATSSLVGLALAALTANAALGAEATAVFSIPAGTLDDTLARFSRQAGITLAYDPRLVSGRHSAGLEGRYTATTGLDQLLGGTHLTYRRLANGGYAIVAPPAVDAVVSPPRLDADTPTTLPELLVVGRKSLNADIPRSRDDIQPYRVATDRDIANAQVASIEDFMRSRATGNASAIALSQAPVLNRGSARSAINLGGFGVNQTLVLVDGRRMPSLPAAGDLLQPDLNAIAPGDVERIEVLTSSASGIYGSGAVGGVVNVVLKRPSAGLELVSTSRVSDQGDSRRWGLEGRWGGTSRSGATRAVLTVSYAEDAGLRVGDRDFIRQAFGETGPVSVKLNIVVPSQIDGAGPPLPSYIVSDEERFDRRLSQDGLGTLQSLLTRTRTSSALASVRHSFTPRFEVFLDALHLANRGAAAGPWLQQQRRVFVDVGANGNPYPQGIYVNLPTSGSAGVSSTDIASDRVTLGAIARLPAGWSANLDLTAARARVKTSAFDLVDTDTFLAETGVDLFAGIDGLKAALAQYPTSATTSVLNNRMTDLSARLAGPFFETGAGTATLSLLIETRREHMPSSGEPDAEVAEQTQWVRSGYAELRAPITRLDAPFSLARGLELQLAGRVDRFNITTPLNDFGAKVFFEDTQVRWRRSTGTVTVGAKAQPIDGLALRASYSTGYLPPSPSQLQVVSYVDRFGSSVSDPKRPGDFLGPFRVLMGGSATLRSERARTYSAGLVVTPDRLDGLRVSIDFSRTEKHDEIASPLNGGYEELFVLEDVYPGIMRRAPLTAADIAKGYTVGAVEFFDGSLRNVGFSRADTIDLDLDYQRDTAMGQFSPYARATWRLSGVRRGSVLNAPYQTVGVLDGPLAFRLDAGLDWTGKAWTAGINLQFYSDYRTRYAGNDLFSTLQSAVARTVQGADTIPSQTYVDGYIARSFGSKGSQTVIRLGVRNLMGQRPPPVVIPLTTTYSVSNVTDQGIGYSAYGDPRGRRFELVLRRQF
ncbi:TonB-dependent receptor [Caulobacter sp. UNC279MFTsu5.1]|uniref:TonB-dependent receptor n=1 Tax=Caulobacter sp. UNC279MFTsu5.1 TaxID=1502775 RepID=UPI0008E4E6DF|nr:TonB-dependent receptor [Caulobacter sp. UNC279MFTsu5.1]SFI52997.1 Secretin and TonB N terminus short domain-containing protein [Caulobacter sp. UNC279MFTsu5.1]